MCVYYALCNTLCVCVCVVCICVSVYKLKQRFLELMFILLLECNLMFSILFHFYFLINLFLWLH